MKFVLQRKNILLVIYGVFIVAVASAISNPVIFRKTELVLPYVNIAVILLGIAITLLKNNAKDFFYIVIGSVLVLSIHFINGSSYGSIVSYLGLILAIILFSESSFEDDTVKIIAGLGFIYLFLSLLRSQTFFKTFSTGVSSINPNTICVFIAVFSVFVNAEFYRHSLWAIIYNLFALYTIFKYESRTSLAAFILFLVFTYFVPRKIWKNKKVTIIIFSIVFILAIVFPIFYINAPAKLVSMVTSITHKSFYSGREIIWGRFYRSLMNPKNLIIGPGSSQESVYTTIAIFGQQRVFSMHSSYLGIMLNFGLLGIFYFYYFILKRVLAIYDQDISDKQIISLIGLIMILIIGSTEVIFTYSYFVFFFAMIMSTISSSAVKSVYSE